MADLTGAVSPQPAKVPRPHNASVHSAVAVAVAVAVAAERAPATGHSSEAAGQGSAASHSTAGYPEEAADPRCDAGRSVAEHKAALVADAVARPSPDHIATSGPQLQQTGRRASAPRRAFVFGGGGVLGFAWIVGALTALEHELEVRPTPDDLMIGTSAGAVTAGILSCGVSVDSIRRHQLGMPLPEDPPINWNYERDSGGSRPPRPGWRPGSPRLLWGGIRNPTAVPPVVALSGLLPAGRGTLEPIQHMISAVATAADQEGEWPAPRTWIIATDYASGRRVVFGRADAPAAPLSDAVGASCAIPAWYAPVRISGRRYIDGGTTSNASVDLVDPFDYDEAYVLAPMAALEPDSPRTPVAMVERRVRRTITRGILRDVSRLRSHGVRVTLLTPGAEDLTMMGANLMNPRRRLEVLHTAMRTAAIAIRQQQRRPALDEARYG